MEEKMNCPHCGTEQVRRSPRRSVVERLSTVVIDRWPYRCLLCNTRFFARRLFSESVKNMMGASARYPSGTAATVVPGSVGLLL
jgi:hypothetical protein